VSSAVAARARATPLSLVRAVPALAWLTAVVVLSAAVRYWFARRMPAPWIVADELVYSELAKSFAASGSFEVRDVSVGRAFGVVYPVLISPAYLFFDSLVSAYAAVKAINAALISLAAVPAYLLARRVLAPGPSLVATVLAVSVPGMLYATTVMTENAFYPLFLAAALALVLALERPTPLRVLLLLGVVGLAFLTRSQAVLLLPAIATAPLLLLALERRGPRTLGAHAWLLALPAAAVGAVVAGEVLRGRSPLDLLGAYRPVGEADYDLGAVPKWVLWHVAELDLSLGFVPFAALLLGLAVAPRLDRGARIVLAAAASLAFWMVLGVSVFASRHALRIEERNLFYVQALFLLALVLWIDRGLPRPTLATSAAAAVTAALPALVPFETVIDVSAVSDTLGLMPWWDFLGWGVPLEQLWIGALLAGVLAALLVALWPRRLAYGLVAVVAVYLGVSAWSAGERMRVASVGALFQGTEMPQRDWIDHAVGRDGDVAAVYSGVLDRFTIVQNEFFSRSVGTVYTLGPSLPADIQILLSYDLETGLLRDPSGRAVPARHALVDHSVPLAGSLVERDDRKGITLLDVSGLLRVTHHVDGVYVDGWSGPTARYRRFQCAGGTLVATVESDPSLFRRDQVVVARVGGRAAARARIPRTEKARIRVPLEPRNGRCDVTFSIAPTAVPGPEDTRRLGTHFRSFRYRP
jgi:hypothetical protein